MKMCNIIDGFPPGASKLSRVFAAYEALTLVRHGTRYDTGHGDTSFLENLGYDTGGVYVFLYIFYILLSINYVYSWFFIKKKKKKR
jgi:hypothetical protein